MSGRLRLKLERYRPLDKYLGYCWLHNSEPEESRRFELSRARHAYTDGLRDAGVNVGHLFMSADLHFLDRGHDRPMCCGFFLDIEEAGTVPIPDDVRSLFAAKTDELAELLEEP